MFCPFQLLSVNLLPGINAGIDELLVNVFAGDDFAVDEERIDSGTAIVVEGGVDIGCFASGEFVGFFHSLIGEGVEAHVYCGVLCPVDKPSDGREFSIHADDDDMVF